MASTYTPLQLVHAHLPANPPNPKSIPVWNATTKTKPSSPNEPLHPEHASSAAFDPLHRICARVIDNGYQLELRALNLHQSQALDPVRIAFAQPLLPISDSSLASTGNVFCIFVATANTFYRISIPVDHNGTVQLRKTPQDGWCEAFAADEDVTPWLALDNQLVVMTGADGSLIRADQERAHRWSHQRHRPAVSRLRLPSFIAGRTDDEQAVCLARHGYLVYALSRNGRLRLWQTQYKTENVRIVDLEAPIESNAQHIRIVPHPAPTRYSHLVVIYRPGGFVVYRATDSGELVLAGERTARPGTLCGFEINDNRLYATFDRGVIEHESVAMDDIFQFTTYIHSTTPEWSRTVIPADNLDPAYFDNLLGSAPPDPAQPYENYDIPETFLHHLFHSGRFSPLTLITALEECEGHSPRFNGGTLVERYSRTVGAALQMGLSTATGAPIVGEFRQAMKREWLKVWARARDLDRHGRWPIASASWRDQTFVITREGVSVPVAQDVTGYIRQLSEDGAPDLPSPYTALADTAHQSALVAIDLAGSYLTSILEAQAERPLSNLAADMQLAARDGLQESVEDFAFRIGEEHVSPYMLEDTGDRLRSFLSDCSDVPTGLQLALDVLAEFDVSAADMPYSGFGNALLTSTIQATISSRHRFAQNVFLIMLFYLADADLDDEEAVFDLVSQSIDMWNQYGLRKWLASASAPEAAIPPKKRMDDISSNLSSLRVGDKESDGYDTSVSLIHHLLASQLPPLAPELALAASTWLSQISDEALGLAILHSGLPLLAGEYADRLPASSCVMYLRGRAAVVAGDVEGIVANFEKAASGVSDGSLESVLPGASLFDYYRHVVQLCSEEPNAALYFGQNALRLVPDSQHKSLWVAVYLAARKLQRYEQAYSIVAAAPSQWQKDLLDSLVTDMCEHHQIGRLNTLGFVNLSHHVEEHLRFQADNSDPFKRPNYYQILYSWYITRGDYRSAGDIMYRQAQRYRDIYTLEGLGSQAKCYLAAINALQLVDKRNAWIIINGPPASTPALKEWKRRKVSAYIPESEFAVDKKPVHILDIEDIRGLYALVLARLRIGQQISVDNAEQTPAETVATAIQQGMYDLALATAHQGHVAMEEIFRSLATRCVEASDPRSHTAYVYHSHHTSRLRGSPEALSLRYLEIALMEYDSADTHYAHRIIVADTFFSLNSNKRNGWRMPAWLVSWEMERDPEGWIGMAVKWGWIEEALEWSAELLRKVPPPELLPRDRTNVAALPYNLFDRVLAAANEGDEKDDKRVQAKVAVLRQAIERRVTGLRKLEGR